MCTAPGMNRLGLLKQCRNCGRILLLGEAGRQSFDTERVYMARLAITLDSTWFTSYKDAMIFSILIARRCWSPVSARICISICTHSSW